MLELDDALLKFEFDDLPEAKWKSFEEFFEADGLEFCWLLELLFVELDSFLFGESNFFATCAIVSLFAVEAAPDFESFFDSFFRSMLVV